MLCFQSKWNTTQCYSQARKGVAHIFLAQHLFRCVVLFMAFGRSSSLGFQTCGLCFLCFWISQWHTQATHFCGASPAEAHCPLLRIDHICQGWNHKPPSQGGWVERNHVCQWQARSQSQMLTSIGVGKGGAHARGGCPLPTLKSCERCIFLHWTTKIGKETNPENKW